MDLKARVFTPFPHPATMLFARRLSLAGAGVLRKGPWEETPSPESPPEEEGPEEEDDGKAAPRPAILLCALCGFARDISSNRPRPAGKHCSREKGRWRRRPTRCRFGSSPIL